MVTKNFLNLLAMALQSGDDLGALLVRGVDGATRYLTGGVHAFISSPTKAVTLTATAAGISVGTGNTAATEDDWQLAEPMTSGINLALAATRYGADAPSIPYVEYDVTVTNTGSDPITIKEIGYKQIVKTAKYPGYSTNTADTVCLLDRSVLDTPVTIAAGDAGIITYKLRTIPRAYGTVAGVQMASFTYGTDAEITAILDAAAAGDVDLQRDAGWRVGDMRKIHIDAFTGGNSVSCPAQDVFIAISSFDEYTQGLGNLLQFDFAVALSQEFRMTSSGTTSGGYGASEIYTTTLPALAEALPTWIKNRLKTFSVLAGSGGTTPASQTLETVTNNKLALRSATEIFGANTLGVPGEGTMVDLYTGLDNRIKCKGLDGATTYWHTRSAADNAHFIDVSPGGSQYTNYLVSRAVGVAPFGCLGGLTT